MTKTEFAALEARVTALELQLRPADPAPPQVLDYVPMIDNGDGTFSAGDPFHPSGPPADVDADDEEGTG